MTTEDLQNHTKIIMQNALAKRKFEEQQTNILGMQKLLQLNAVATAAAAAAAAATGNKQQHHQQQHHHSQLTAHSRLTAGALTTNRATNGNGNRRLQALQNLFNDSNGKVDSIDGVPSKSGFTNSFHSMKSQSNHSGVGMYRNSIHGNNNSNMSINRRRSFPCKFTNVGHFVVPPTNETSNSSETDSQREQQPTSSAQSHDDHTETHCHSNPYHDKNDANNNCTQVDMESAYDAHQTQLQQPAVVSTGCDEHQ
ncbi:unnamed protein product [Ceratitis capitata]|uniref:(Mediterranean fruit fly) hypothetical protein n=1 Tax=Ceratitis capitata TaxID=7213 RepID=A0A811UFK6_CERCA|nr:unnamed protein product [Ceratitis capitata]